MSLTTPGQEEDYPQDRPLGSSLSAAQRASQAIHSPLDHVLGLTQQAQRSIAGSLGIGNNSLARLVALSTPAGIATSIARDAAMRPVALGLSNSLSSMLRLAAPPAGSLLAGRSVGAGLAGGSIAGAASLLRSLEQPAHASAAAAWAGSPSWLLKSFAQQAKLERIARPFPLGGDYLRDVAAMAGAAKGRSLAFGGFLPDAVLAAARPLTAPAGFAQQAASIQALLGRFAATLPDGVEEEETSESRVAEEVAAAMSAFSARLDGLEIRSAADVQLLRSETQVLFGKLTTSIEQGFARVVAAGQSARWVFFALVLVPALVAWLSIPSLIDYYANRAAQLHDPAARTATLRDIQDLRQDMVRRTAPVAQQLDTALVRKIVAVYASTQRHAPVLATATPGRTLLVLAERKRYLYVRYLDGQGRVVEGWMRKKYLRRTGSATRRTDSSHRPSTKKGRRTGKLLKRSERPAP